MGESLEHPGSLIAVSGLVPKQCLSAITSLLPGFSAELFLLKTALVKVE